MVPGAGRSPLCCGLAIDSDVETIGGGGDTDSNLGTRLERTLGDATSTVSDP